MKIQKSKAVDSLDFLYNLYFMKELKKDIWHKSNLSKSVFRNNKLNIDSEDIRNSNNITELKAVAEYLQSHLIETNNFTEFIYEDDKKIKHRNYLFTQSCLKSQVDWKIFKIRTKSNKIKS
jgi:hypothetical protein